MKGLIAFLAVTLATASVAEARMHAPYRGHRIVPTSAAPLDGFTQPAAAYSMRRLKSSYTGPAIRLRRASDNAETDINFLSFTGFTGAPIDTAAAAAHCAATSCFVVKSYDQSGNGKDRIVDTVPHQPAVFFNCLAGLPCMRRTAAGQILFNTAVTTTAGNPLTLNAVGRHAVRPAPGGYLACGFAGAGTNAMNQHVDYDVVVVTNSSADVNVTAAYATWHSFTTAYASGGTGTSTRVDAAETPSTLAAGGGTNVFTTSGDTSTCDEVEFIVWGNYAMPQSERAALHANQKSFWGF